MTKPLNKETIAYIRAEYRPPGAPTKEPFKTAMMINRLLDEIERLQSLVDGAYGVVELYKPLTPAQTEWRAVWLTKAANAVPQYD